MSGKIKTLKDVSRNFNPGKGLAFLASLAEDDLDKILSDPSLGSETIHFPPGVRMGTRIVFFGTSHLS